MPRGLHKATLLVAPLVCVGLMMYVAVLSVRAMRRVSLSNEQIRQVLMTELSRVLQQPVTVQKVTGDVWRGVTFWGLVIGANPQLPDGAFFRARSVTVKFAGKAILTRKINAAEGIQQIVVEGWSAYLERNREGVWNFQYLLKPKKPVQERKFAAQVLVRAGTVYLKEATRRSPKGQPLFMRIEGVNGPIQFAGDKPVAFDVRVDRAVDVWRAAEVAATVRGVGAVHADGSFVRTTIDFQSADAVYGAEYLFPQSPFRVESGRAGGAVEIVWAKLPEPEDRFAFRGALSLRRASAWVKWLGERRLRHISGEVAFNDRLVTLPHVSAVIGGTPFTVKGNLHLLQTVQFDLRLRSDRAQVEEIYALLGGDKLGATIKAFGTAVVDAHIVGTPSSASLTASAKLPRLAVQHPRFGRVSGGPWRAQAAVDDFFRPVLFGKSSGAVVDVSGLEFGPFRPDEESTTKVEPLRVPSSPSHEGRGVPSAASATKKSPRAARSLPLSSRERARHDGNRVALGTIQVEGVTDVHLQFAHIPTNPTVTGTFKARRGWVGAIAFEGLQARASYHDRFFALRAATAKVGDGHVKFDLDVDLRDKEPHIALTSALHNVDVRCLQPYLTGQGWDVAGPASGTLNIHGVPQKLVTEFNVRLPQSQWVNELPVARDAVAEDNPSQRDGRHLAVLLRDVHLVGLGTVERSANHDWDFEGEAGLSASHAECSLLDEGRSVLLAEGATCRLRGKVAHRENRLLPDVKARVQAERGTLGDVFGKVKELPLSQARASLDITAQRVRADDCRADAWGGSIEGALTVELTDERIVGTFRGTDVDLGAVARFGGREDVKGVGTVTVVVRGRPDAPRADVTLRAYGAQWRDVPFGLVDARLNVDNRRVTIQRGTLWQGGARYVVRGEIDDFDWEKPEGRLSLAVEVQAARLSHLLKLFGAEWDAEALCEATLHVSGTLQDPQVTADAVLTHGRYAQRATRNAQPIPVYVEKATVKGTYHQRRFALSYFAAVERDAKVEGSGSVDLDGKVAIQFRGEGVPVAALIGQTNWKTNVEGTVNAEGAFVGTREAPRLTATIQSARLVWEQKGAGHLAGRVTWDGRSLRATPLTFEREGLKLHVDGTLPLDAQSPTLSAALVAQDTRLQELVQVAAIADDTFRENGVDVGWLRAFLQTVRQLPQPVTGDLNGTVRLSGSWSDLIVPSAQFRLDNPRLSHQNVPAVDAALGWSGRTLTVERFVATLNDKPVLHVAAGGRIAPEGEVTLTVAVNDFDLSFLQPWLQRWGLPEPWHTELTKLQGKANVTARFSGWTRTPNITATHLTVSELKTAHYALDKVRADAVVWSNEKIETRQPAEVTLRGSRFWLSGAIPFAWEPFGLPPDGVLQVHIAPDREESLKMLEAFFPDLIESAAGEFTEASLHVTGTIAAPRFGGRLSVRHGAVAFKAFDTKIKNLSGDVRLEEKLNAIVVEISGALDEPPIAAPANGRSRRAQPRDAGGFRLGGSVWLDSAHLTAWHKHRYNLALSLKNAQFDSVLIPFTAPQESPRYAPRVGAPSAALPSNGLWFSGVSDVNADAQLQTDGTQQVLHIRHLSGRGMRRNGRDGGTLTVSGTVTLAPDFYTWAGWAQSECQLNLTAQRFQVEVLSIVDQTWSRLIRGEISTAPAVTYSGQTVSGALVLAEAEVKGIPSLPVSRTAGELPNVPRFDRLKVGLGRDVRLNAPRLRTPLSGLGKVSEQEKREGLPNVAVMVTGTPRTLQLTGSVEARSGGEMRFPNAVMRLLHARVDFALSPDEQTREWKPRVTVDAAARGHVDRYDVNLTITGPLLVGDEVTEPRLSATSTPTGLSESQVLSRLVGTAAEKDVGREFQRQLLRLVQVAPAVETLFSEFEESLHALFGLELFSLEYRPGAPTHVRLGKALGRDLFVTYRRSVSGSTQTYSLRLDYRLKGQMLLGFETDERRRQQITLDWTFRFGGKE
ncbi:MAG: translocation/assembly module TamB domain-containing protein [Abditibacteriales bacterium]|nr:translocation/assembly module TamB domain-containing protein [Abditibacteriales bacterium]MDW8364318.1 translocation/assembly module TamB domain-containing protein [Abditibacteriales bacterium]